MVINVGFIPLANLIGRADIVFFSQNIGAGTWQATIRPSRLLYRIV